MNSVNKKLIIKNTLLLYFRIGITMLVALYTSRVVLNALGVEDYGIYNVIGGIVGLFSFMNAALSSSTSRFLTFELGRGDYCALTPVFRSSIAIHLFLVFIVIALAETIGLWLVNTQLIIPPDRLFSANVIYQLVILGSVIVILQVPLTSLIIAHEKMNIYAYVAILDALLKLVVAYILTIYKGDKLIIYGVMVTGEILLIFFIYFFYTKRNYENLIFRPLFEQSIFHEMFSYSAWTLWGKAAFMFRDQGGNMLLNIFFGPVVNASRGIAYQVTIAVNSFMQNFTVAISPQIIKAYASGEKQAMISLLYGGSKLSFYLLFILAAPIIVKMDYILSFWLITVPQDASIFTTLMLVNALLESYTYVIETAIQATGRIKWYQIIVSLVLLLNLPISYVFLKLGYLPYVVFLISIGLTFFSLLIRIIFLSRILNVSLYEYFFEVVGLTLFVGSFSLFLTWWIVGIISIDGMRSLLLTVFLSTFFTVVNLWIIGLKNSDRAKIIMWIKEKKKS